MAPLSSQDFCGVSEAGTGSEERLKLPLPPRTKGLSGVPSKLADSCLAAGGEPREEIEDSMAAVVSPLLLEGSTRPANEWWLKMSKHSRQTRR